MHKPVWIQVTPEEARQRLDAYLSRKLEGVSRSAVQRWIEKGAVQVDGVIRKAGHRTRPGEEIRVVPPPPEPSDLVPEAIRLDVVYEDPILLVVNKPAGMVVHPGAGNWRGTLVNALLHHLGNLKWSDPLRPGLVHRLDKETSGILVVAKSERAHQDLSRQFKTRQVEKVYLALVYGHPEPQEGLIEAPLGRHPRVRTRMSTRSRKPREAVTAYRVLQRYPDFSLLRVEPRTGRTHQIRVHLQSVGHPVVGDQTYGKKAEKRITDPALLRWIRDLGRHFLHAQSLTFRHPETQKTLSFTAPLPRELDQFLQALG